MARNAYRFLLLVLCCEALVGGVFAQQPPFICGVVSGQTVSAGQNVEFCFFACGSGPLTYQWRRNGIDLPGATREGLRLYYVQAEDAGSYQLFVTNAYGSVTSSVAVLTVIHQIQPQALAIDTETSASFTLYRWGTPCSYLWLSNNTAISGATEQTLVVSGEVLSSANYQCVFSNGYINATSAVAQLFVRNGTVLPWGLGSSAVSVPLTLTDPIAIAVGENFAFALKDDGTLVSCRTNSSTPLLSNVVAIAVGSSHGLALLQNGTVAAWGDNTFGQRNIPVGLSNVAAIAAYANHCLVLLSNGRVVAWGQNTNGVNDVPTGLSNVVSIATGLYHGLALENDGTVVGWGRTNEGQLNIPADVTNATAISAGDFHSVALRSNGTVVAWGDNSLRQLEGHTALTNIIAIAAGASHTLALRSNRTVVAFGNNDCVQSVVPDGWSNVVSIAASRAYSAAVAYRTRVAVLPSRVLDVGTNVTLTLIGVSSTNWSLEWQHNGMVIAEATNRSLSLTNVQAVDAGRYRAIARHSRGYEVSAFADVAVVPLAPLIAGPPLTQAASAGNDVALAATAVGSEPMSYQWFFNGVELAGQTGSTLLLTNVQSSGAGSYSVIVSNEFGQVTSPAAELTVAPAAPRVLRLPEPRAARPFSTVTLRSKVRGTEPLSFQWFLNGTNLPGQTGSTLVITNFRFPDVGRYTYVVSNAVGVSTGLVGRLNASGYLLRWGDGSPQFPEILATNVSSVDCYSTYVAYVCDNGTVFGLWDSTVKPTNAVWVASPNVGTHVLDEGGNFFIWRDGGFTTESDVVSVAVYWDSYVALKADGCLTGNSSYDCACNNVPIALSNIVDFAKFTYNGGGYALQDNGRLVAWGQAMTTSGAPPPPPVDLTNVVAIAAGAGHALAITADDRVVRWGGDDYWHSATYAPSRVPKPVRIVSQDRVDCIVRADGSVDVWGVGTGSLIVAPTWPIGATAAALDHNGSLYTISSGPGFVSPPQSRFVPLRTNVTFTAQAISPTPMIYQWRFEGTDIPGATDSSFTVTNVQSADLGRYTIVLSNSFGAVAESSAMLRLREPQVAGALIAWYQGNGWVGPTNAVAVSVKEYYWAALLTDGSISGNPGTSQKVSGEISIAVGEQCGLLLKENGTVAIWTEWGFVTPPYLNNVRAIASGGSYFLALKDDGSIVTISTAYSYPVEYGPEPQKTNILGIAAAHGRNYAILDDGSVATWGTDVSPPPPPGLLTNVLSISCSPDHAVALNKDGSVVVWGGTATNPPCNSNFVAVAAATTETLGVRSDGTLVTWNGSSPLPSGLTRAFAVAGGEYGFCAITPDPVVLIEQAPCDRTVRIGGSADFFVYASGGGELHYQWRFNGSIIPGATNDSVRLTNVQSSGVCSVDIWDDLGGTASASATLTVIPIILEVSRATNNLVLTWPAWATNCVLEQATNLSPPVHWLTATNFTLTGDVIQATIPLIETQRFFRIRGP